MFKACSRCGKIHDTRYNCSHNKPTVDYSRYAGAIERKLRNTAAWAKKSQEIREAAQQLCEVCRDKAIYNYRNLEVHHITPLRDDTDGLLVNDNLICLCAKHHKQADSGRLDAEYLRALARKREDKRN